MRHHTAPTLNGQSPAVAARLKRLVLAGALAACLAGGALAHSLATQASQSHATHLAPALADGCPSSAGPCLPILI